MSQVYISLGSNIEPVRYLRAALAELEARYGRLRVSSVYESAAMGFSGNNFYNLVAGFDSAAPPETIQGSLREIEDRNGRSRHGPKFSARTLDLDLLLYGDLRVDAPGLHLPRGEILEYAFVLCPLAELAPQARHPLTGQSYAELWAVFDQASQPVWKLSPSPLSAHHEP
jgi:2-amino-4-hydroxy-6-hydroxymethyldihydropteridine diphosphokinase